LAVRVQPFEDTGGPLKDVSPYAEYVDFASIQAFDINGPWSNSTGPSAPLEHQRSRGAQYSLKQSIDQWLDARWPADKLVAGVAFHGHSLTTRDVLTAKEGSEMYVPFDRSIPRGDDEDALWYDVCENVNSMSGVWQYRHLRDQGILKTANTTGDEWIRVWDDKSSTPWLYSPQIRRFISYDDPASLEKKVDLARSRGLKGIMAWSLHADYNGELLSAISRIGPLCRGPKSNSDQPASSSSSASPESSKSAEPSPAPAPTSASEASSSSAAPASTTPSPEQQSRSSPDSASSTSEAVGRSILFDSMGSPYIMANGHSTAMPLDIAEKLMQIGEASATPSSESHKLPGGPLDIPVADNVKTAHMTAFVTGPIKIGLGGVVSSIFDTAGIVPTHDLSPMLGSGDSQASSPGFAATFLLALDTTSQPSGFMATTVIPMSQLMASAKSGTMLGGPNS
ncbi:hypothetical protein LPJ61_006242, partial [Coemansia biformis]